MGISPLAAAQNWATTHPDLEAHIYVRRWGRYGTLTTEYYAAGGRAVRDAALGGVSTVCNICGHINIDGDVALAGRPDARAGEPFQPGDLPAGERCWPWLRVAAYTSAFACRGCVEAHGLSTERPLQYGKDVVYVSRRDELVRFQEAAYIVRISLLGAQPEAICESRAILGQPA